MTTLPPSTNFDVQVVAVQEQHTHKRGAAQRVGLNVPWLTVPKRNDAMYTEADFGIVSQGRPAPEHIGQLQLRHQRRRQGQSAAVAGVYHGIYFPRLSFRPTE